MIDTSTTVPPIGGVGGFVRDAHGHFYTSRYDLRQVLKFDSTGKFVSAIGGPGFGPGEFGLGRGGIQSLFLGPEDSLYVFFQPPAISVFAPDHSFARTIRLRTQRIEFAVLPTGELILREVIRTPSRVGFALHRTDPTGTLTTSFAPEDQGPSAVRLARFKMAPDFRSAWLASLGEYRFQQWSTDGALLRNFRLVDVPWLAREKGGTGANPGSASVTIAGIDKAGMIWINAVYSTPSGTVERRLEVIDPATTSVVVSRTVPSAMYFVGGTELLSGHEELPNGDLRFTIWHATILR